jgi:hypothetical protein
MNNYNKYFGLRKKFTTDRNYISKDEELRLNAEKEELDRIEHEKLENERIKQEELLNHDPDEGLFNDLMEDLENIPKHRKNILKEFIKENKDDINSIDYKYKEQLLRYIKEKFY